MKVGYGLAASIVFALTGMDLSHADSARESTDLYIRRLAGLPASSARGDIQILDVGHLPMSTMISIVANHTRSGWRVSYACAASPYCAAGQDHLAKDYSLSAQASQRVDAILERLRTGGEPDATRPSATMVCGWLSVVIDYQGFRRTYDRACSWGRELGELEDVLKDSGG